MKDQLFTPSMIELSEKFSEIELLESFCSSLPQQRVSMTFSKKPRIQSEFSKESNLFSLVLR